MARIRGTNRILAQLGKKQHYITLKAEPVKANGAATARQDIAMELSDTKITGRKHHVLVDFTPATLKDPGTKLARRVECPDSLCQSRDAAWSRSYKEQKSDRAEIVDAVQGQMAITASSGFFRKAGTSSPGGTTVNPKFREKKDISRDA